MRILGIDPGIATVGFGIVDSEKNKLSLVNYGVITTPAKTSLSSRLDRIYDDMTELCKAFSPDAIACEELFFNTNQKTVLSVGQARGVIVLGLAQKGLALHEYTPLQVKQTVAGYGRAEKKQVMEMVRRLLGMDDLPRPDDAADALAVAICHVQELHTAGLLSRQGGL